MKPIIECKPICFVFLILSLFLNFPLWAGPLRTTYQARIIKPNGEPLQANSVSFRFTILDPTGSCILYIEDYAAVNMTGSSGLISFSLGSGIRSYPVSGSASTLSSVFNNSTTSFSCQSPGIYTPVPSDNRKIVMQFNDASGWQTLPAMAINAVPYAMYADDTLKLNGKSDTDFVQSASLPTCTAGQALFFNGVSFSCVATGGGGVTSSTITAALGYAPADGASYTSLVSNLATVSSTVYSVSSTLVGLQNEIASLTTTVSNLNVSSPAIISVNGSTSGTQSFANSTAGNAPAFVTANGVHTLNIPLASATASVTAGLISNSDYMTFMNKMNATSASIISALGYTPASSTAFVLPAFSGDVTSVSGSSVLTIANSGVTAATYSKVTVNAKGLVTSGSQLTASDVTTALGYTPQASGATSSQWTTSGTTINYMAGNVGVGTATPVTALDVSGGVRISMEAATCAVSYAGTLRYNAGNVEFCNGSSWSAFGVSSSGLTSLNGSTSQTQTFALGTFGTTPGVSTTNGVHTFNFPVASTAGVTAGLLSNADYSSFAAKVTSSAAAIAQVLGYTPAASGAAATDVNALHAVNNLSDLSNVATARTNLGLGTFATASNLDLGSASATGTLAAARLPAFSGDITSSAGSATLTLANSGVSAGTYSKVTVDNKGRVTSSSALSFGDVTTALGYTPAASGGVNSGALVQLQRTNFTSATTVSGRIPNDGTVPQSNEGGEVMTVAITPRNATNKLLVEALVFASEDSNSEDTFFAAIFRDSGNGAICSGAGHAYSSTYGIQVVKVSCYIDAASTSATTFKVRVGGDLSNGIININQDAWERTVSGLTSYIQVSEIGSSTGAGVIALIADNDGNTKIHTEQNSNENKIRFDTAGFARMIIDSNGNVGIGTSSPNSELDVSGTIRATQICDRNGNNCQIISSGWSGMSGSGTTILSGWPDAIRCKSSGGIDYILYLAGDYDSSLKKYYSTSRATTGDQSWMIYNTDGTYYSNVSMGGGFDCVTSTMSITQLYNANQAYKFVGGGAGTVSQVTAVAPLLVSGTVSPQISIATGGSVSGQTLRFDGASWQRSKLFYTDLVNSTATSPWPASSCSAGQAIIWSSATDSFVCSDLQILSSRVPATDLASNVSGGVTGVLPITNGGTGLSAVGASGTVLTSNGVSATWTSLDALTAGQNNTMVSGWPDAIKCTTDYGERILYLNSAPYSADNRYYYMEAQSSGANGLYLAYNSNGTFYSSTGYSSLTTCNTSIATIYSQGRAFNFAKGPVGQWLASGTSTYLNSGNVGIGTTTPSQKLSVFGIIESTNGGFKFPDGSIQTTAATGVASGGGLVLGAWQTRSMNTVYQADSDGLVIAKATGTSVAGYTDSSSSPVTLRATQGTASVNANLEVAITMPVRKGDYWRTSFYNGGTYSGGLSVYWIPFVSGVPDSAAVGSDKQIQFNDNGILAGANNLSWDKLTSRLGIGTTAPAAKLDVAGEVKFGNTSSTCNASNEGQQRYNSTSKNMEFCNGTAWTAYSSGGGSGLGYGQTWQNVSGSRSLGTTYTNSTGKPIMVQILGYSGGAGGGYVYATVDGGAAIPIGNWNTSGGSYPFAGSLVVPSGSTYVINFSVSAGSPSLSQWHELR